MHALSATRLAVLGALVVVFSSCKSAPEDVPAGPTLKSGDEVVVTKVAKGDEVLVRFGDTPARIRLLGLHAFRENEKDPAETEIANKAVGRLAELVAGKSAKVLFDETERDIFARYLVYLEEGGVDVAKTLIGEGLALTYTEYPFGRESDYLAAELDARAKGLGLWANPGLAKLSDDLRARWTEARQRRQADPPKAK